MTASEETIQGAWEGMSGLKIIFEFRNDGKYIMHVEDLGAEAGMGIFIFSGFGAIPFAGDYDVRDGHIAFRNVDGTPATGADVVYLTSREMHIRLPEKPTVRFRATTAPPAPAFAGVNWGIIGGAGDDEGDDFFDADDMLPGN